MRSIAIALLLITSAVAHAEQPVVLIPTQVPAVEPSPPPRRGLDGGAKVAIAGAATFVNVYLLTAILTPTLDELACGLGEHYGNCGPGHSMLEVPVVGGFINAAQHNDGSTGLGLASSVVQVVGVGMLVGGLATHNWGARSQPRQIVVVPLATPTTAGLGLAGRF
jgi:hypothetical protein